MTVLSTTDPKHLATPSSAQLISTTWEKVQFDQHGANIENANTAIMVTLNGFRG